MSSFVGAHVLSVNLARVRPNPFKDTDVTGIDKAPSAGPVEVRAPGDKAVGSGSGLVGDTIGDRAHHGGDEQAVYAYAREELDDWQEFLGRALPNGFFGENLTTTGLDVSGAVIGERWRLGAAVELQVTGPRLPCATFRGWIDKRGWLKDFTKAAIPGAYLRVVTPGYLGAGDAVTILHKPSHQITVATVFRAFTLEPELLASLLAAGADLPGDTRRAAEGIT